MWYIFSEEGKCLATCSQEPNHEDILSRNEIAIESNETFNITDILLLENVIVQKPPRLPTVEEVQKQLTDAVQTFMDKTAQSKGYDNLLSAVTYAEESAVLTFQTEGIAFRAWRSAVWAYCYAQLAAVLNGERQAPTVEELISELPPLELPSQG